MGEGIVPPEYWELRPLWKNFFENAAAVQFNHRLLVRKSLFSLSLYSSKDDIFCDSLYKPYE
jgi:hypothetical protein